VKSHGGFINLYTEAGRGTTFRVYIPAAGTGSRAVEPGEQTNIAMGKGELILVIDDEAAIREITRATLQAYGYHVITASDGAEGVAVFVEHAKEIKVVVTDIMMPAMDGTAAILALRAIDPHVKIIAASGLSAAGHIPPLSIDGAQAFLAKPFTAEKLLGTLAVVLN